MDRFVFVRFAFIAFALIILTISGSDAAEETPPYVWKYSRGNSDIMPSVRSDPMPQNKIYKAATYRLPNNTKPLHYNVELSTDVHLGKYEFVGKVVIQLEVIEDTPKIVLHARQLNISEVTIQKNGSETSYPMTHKHDIYREFLTLTPQNSNDTFLKDEKWTLTINYSGLLRKDNGGFYMSTYTVENVTHYLATTQFESTDARHGFPCFDEPNRRAIFTISIKHDPSYFALSNMPVDTEKSTTGYTAFLPTVNMSTYLVAFIVSDFNFKKGELYSLPQRVYSRPGTENEQEFALTTGMLVMQRLVEYFGIDFVMPKIDQVAIPDFSAGAMENWGLVTYREEYLLFNKDKSTVDTQAAVACTIAHEYVHQWFGNYVAIEWWTYLWLKEGFATLFTYQGTHDAYPEWGIYQRFHIQEFQRAMADDSIEQRPMTYEVQKPKEIHQLYDLISYSKAASVLSMWQHALTDEVFRQGLQNYLNANNFSAAEEGDLFAAIQQAVNDKGLAVPAEIDVMMSSWTRQGGYPVLIVERNYENGSFVIKQEPFYDDPSKHGNYTWYIPISVAVQSNPDFRDTRATHFMLMDKQINVDDIEVSKDDWLILNKQSTGYYRVNYDEQNWALITDGLIKQPYKIHPRNRAQLIHDAYRFSISGRLKQSILLDLLTYLPKEDQYAPWSTVSNTLQEINRYLNGHENYKKLKQYIAELVGNIYERLGAYEVPGEHHFKKFTRPLVIDLACMAGIESCLQETNNKLIDLIENGVEIEPNLQSQIYCNGIKQSGDKEFDFVFNELLQSSSRVKRGILIPSLACAQDESQVKKVFESSIDVNNSLSRDERKALLYHVYRQGGVGFNTCIDFLKINYANYSNVAELRNLNNDLYLMSLYVVNKDQEKKLLELADFLHGKRYLSFYVKKLLLKNIKKNLDWFEKIGDPIMNYLSTLPKPRNDGTVVIHSSSFGIALIILLITLS